MKNRQVLGNNSHTINSGNTSLPQDNVQDTVVEIKFLAKSWLDDFEKKIFEGKTIDELLNQHSYD